MTEAVPQPPAAPLHDPAALVPVVERVWIPRRSDYRDMWRHAVVSHRVMRTTAWIIAAVAVLATLLTVDVDDRFFTLSPLALPLVLVPLVVEATPAVLAAATWLTPLMREPVTGRLDEQGIAHTGPSGSQSYAWSSVRRAVESKSAFYVLVGSGIMLWVFWFPKRAFPVEELAAIRATVATHVRRFRTA